MFFSGSVSAGFELISSMSCEIIFLSGSGRSTLLWCNKKRTKSCNKRMNERNKAPFLSRDEKLKYSNHDDFIFFRFMRGKFSPQKNHYETFPATNTSCFLICDNPS